ncbi:MAG: BMP family ABC transporter substrate-binding protein [Ruminococcaceae bacterium]|nr:BMP family ABC transporter substrate-binding protein [Oscillospiraceae bacterium]
MKRVLIIAALIIAAIIAGIINISAADTEVANDMTSVGLILNGSKDDRSWSQSHFTAMERTAAELGLNTVCRDNVAVSDFAAAAEELIEQGCEIIIVNSLSYADVILPVAEKHPDIYFFHAAGTTQGRNLATYFGRIYQARFLCGIVAGLQTKTNEIGYVAAFPYSEVNRGINAFTLGVRTVNPDAKVYVTWTESWVDDAAATQATEELLKGRNIDVLTLHTDSNAPLDIAEKNGVMSIGYNTDNSEHYPDTYLTAAVWNWDDFYTPYILKCLQGKFEGEHYWQSYDTGTVSLAPLTENVDEGIAEVVEQYSQKLQSGAFDVFYGPITDNNGMLRVAQDENMTDSILLNSFDWYVEGVVITDG